MQRKIVNKINHQKIEFSEKVLHNVHIQRCSAAAVPCSASRLSKNVRSKGSHEKNQRVLCGKLAAEMRKSPRRQAYAHQRRSTPPELRVLHAAVATQPRADALGWIACTFSPSAFTFYKVLYFQKVLLFKSMLL